MHQFHAPARFRLKFSGHSFNGIDIAVERDQHAPFIQTLKNPARMPSIAQRSIYVDPAGIGYQRLKALIKHDRNMHSVFSSRFKDRMHDRILLSSETPMGLVSIETREQMARMDHRQIEIAVGLGGKINRL